MKLYIENPNFITIGQIHYHHRLYSPGWALAYSNIHIGRFKWRLKLVLLLPVTKIRHKIATFWCLGIKTVGIG